MSINSEVKFLLTSNLQKASLALRDSTRSPFRYLINSSLYSLNYDQALKPYAIYIFINSTCNARCLMCDIGLKNKQSQFYNYLNRGTDFDIQKFAEFIQEIKSFKPTIVIGSTEPLIYPHIIEAVKIIKDAKLKCSITTNGFFLPKYASTFCDLGVDTLNISIDGMQDVHNKIRGIDGLFEKVMSGINILLERNDRPKILIDTVITPLNQMNLYELGKFFNDFEIDNHNFSHMNFISKNMMDFQNNSFGIDYPALKSSIGIIDPSKIDIDTVYDQIIKMKTDFKRVSFWPPIYTKSTLLKYYTSIDFIEGCERCKIPWLTCAIAADGTVLPHTRCYNIPLGNIYTNSFNEIWNGQRIRQLRRDLLKHKAFPACARCCGVF